MVNIPGRTQDYDSLTRLKLAADENIRGVCVFMETVCFCEIFCFCPVPSSSAAL